MEEIKLAFPLVFDMMGFVIAGTGVVVVDVLLEMNENPEDADAGAVGAGSAELGNGTRFG